MINRKALRIIGGSELAKPEFVATKAELETITRFLTFALADLKYQLDDMKKETGHTQLEIQDAQSYAILATNYIKGLSGGIEQMAMRPMVDVTPN